jgi:hypothetical protein
VKYLVLVVVALGVLYAAWKVGERQWFMQKGKQELAEVMTQLDRLDPHWRWDAVTRRRILPPPEAKNSALLIPKIKALTAPDWGHKLNSLANGRDDLAGNIQQPETLAAQMRRDLAASNEAVRLARSLKEMPKGHCDVTCSTDMHRTAFTESMNVNHAAEMLSRDIIVATVDGAYTQVADNLLAALNVSRSIGDEPGIFPQLIRISTRQKMIYATERVLGQTANPEQLQALRLAELQQALMADLDEPLAVYGLRGERAAFAQLSERLHDGPVTELACLGLDRLEIPSDTSFAIGWWLYRGRMHADRAYIIAWYSVAIQAAEQPVSEQFRAFQELPVTPRGNPNHFLANLLLPGARNFVMNYPRQLAQAQCAVVGIACERFRLKYGRWPDNRLDLQPEFIPAIPPDPFDGQPIRFAKQIDGLVVFSSGGEPPPDETTPFIRRQTRPGLPGGIEVGFRLWNPEQRRRPAPPEPKDETTP